MRITMVGHSTVLIECEEGKILTDPYFGLWGNPAYARLAPPAGNRDQFLDVDLVLVSHNHWDHSDGRFLRSLPAATPVVAPARSAWLTRLRGAKTVVAMRPWEERQIAGFLIAAVPACHVAATIGFVIGSREGRIYFAGDTYYRPFMARIGERYNPGVALIPVTTFRIPMTMGERSAVRAVRDLKPRVVIPIHLGLRPRSPLLRTSHTPEGFARRAEQAGLGSEIVILREGRTWAGQERKATPAPPREAPIAPASA
jgi:L-ascorbate metabolism protein UlaG (beta-lactamase superfamily)